MIQTKRPTRNDVARVANVSGCTVSYVLNGRTDVAISEATRTRVLAAAEQLGYRPNRAARALVTGSTHIVSIWAGHLSPFYSLVVNHLRSKIRMHGFEMLITDIEAAPDSHAQSLWPVDGIIAIEYPECADAFMNRHPDFRTPIVSIGAYYAENMDFVGVDLYTGAREAVEHLLASECRRIAFVREAESRLADPRVIAYADAMKDAGREPEYIVVQGNTRADTRLAAREYAASRSCPDGLFCHNDDMAIGVYRGLRDLGIRVPDQAAIVGCDGIEEGEYLECPLTTIVQPVEEMCEQGWQCLQRRIADPSIPFQKTLLPSRLEIRSSSRA